MEYTTLGNTGLEISRICLGCMSFGTSDRSWLLDGEEAKEIIDYAIDAGINFFDTANVYWDGESERILGECIAEYDRDRLVIASKTHPQRSPGTYPLTQATLGADDAGAHGLSRKAIQQDLTESLDRLGLDTIDLYQIHRWDAGTPIGETLDTLDDAVRSGRVRYIGASSMWAHQFGDALHTSDSNGLARFASMQNHYNLVYREEEREMLPLCNREGVGVIPWSPLASGYLARPDNALTDTERGAAMAESEWLSERMELYRSGGGVTINERVAELAEQYGVSMAQIALAWLLHQDVVDAPIVGISSLDHLKDAVAAVDLDLSASDLSYLADPYEPKPVAGHT